MNRMYLFMFLGLLSFSFGCQHDHYVSPKPGGMPGSAADIRGKTETSESRVTITDEVSTKLRVSLAGSGSEPTFSRKLAERIGSAILPDHAEYVSGDSCDIRVIVIPEFELADTSGEYQRIRCSQVKAMVLCGGTVKAVKVVEPKDLPRQLGIQKAKDQYLKPVEKELVPFLKKELTRLSNQEIAVSEIGFNLANVQEKPDGKHVAYQVERISQILARTQGVVNYTLVRQDTSRATCTFRIAYLKKKFPQGLSNYINLSLARK